MNNEIILKGKINNKNFDNLKLRKKRAGSYRMVSVNDEKHIIEKKKKFLCWKWWSRNYLYDINGCYIVDDEDTAKRILKILTKE